MGLVEKFIEQNYDLIEYIYFRNSVRSPRVKIAKHIEEKYGTKPITILDMCTGTGESLLRIAEKNKSAVMTGIDLSRNHIEKSITKAKRKGFTNVAFSVMDAGNTSFQDKRFDVIIISLVLHELNEKYANKLLTEAKRLLKDDGILLVVEWSIPEKIIKKILFYPIIMIEANNLQSFTTHEIYRLFSKQNLEVVHHGYCDYTQIFELRMSNIPI